MRDYDQSTTYLQLKWRRVLNPDTEFSLRYGFKEDRADEKGVIRTMLFLAKGNSYPFFNSSGTKIDVLFIAEGNTSFDWAAVAEPTNWRRNTTSVPLRISGYRGAAVGVGTRSTPHFPFMGNRL
jgi:hypothetical protein